MGKWVVEERLKSGYVSNVNVNIQNNNVNFNNSVSVRKIEHV